jgi:trimethylamine--corrinoid protein Co-methyltransferase
MANYYQLPNSVIAGATDAKTADAQSGFEKSLNITLAAQAGANLITQACGMHAGLMAAALESYVIDSEMAGAILRSLAPVEVSTDTLMLTAIDETAKGAGHFLGHADTYARMHSDFLYPELACRLPVETWTQAGAEDIHSRARKKVTAILSSPPETHIPKTIETALRQKYALPDLDG